jgi:4-hydroxythreonine-4-phosphate dehydrogenase
MNGELKLREIPRIAFVMGDPAGISAEIAAKLLVDRTIHERASLLVIGDRRTLAEGERIAGVDHGGGKEGEGRPGDV